MQLAFPKRLPLVLLVLLCSSTKANADSFRCGSFLAREGMSSDSIEEICGKPDVVKMTEEPILVRRPNGTTFNDGVVTTRYWYYERGPNEFVARVTIRDGIAEEVELLEARLLEALDLD